MGEVSEIGEGVGGGGVSGISEGVGGEVSGISEGVGGWGAGGIRHKWGGGYRRYMRGGGLLGKGGGEEMGLGVHMGVCIQACVLKRGSVDSVF